MPVVVLAVLPLLSLWGPAGSGCVAEDSGEDPAVQMADRIRIKCSACGRNLAVPSSAAGRKTRCPECQHKILIPGAAERSPDRRQRAGDRSTTSGGKSGRGDKSPTSGRHRSDARASSSDVSDRDGEDDFFTDVNSVTTPHPTTRVASEPEVTADDFADAPPGRPVARAKTVSSDGDRLPPRRKKKKKPDRPRIKSSYNEYLPPSIESRTGRPEESRQLTPSDILLCLLCSGLGFVVGIIRVCSDNQENGRKMILLSFVVPLVLLVAGIVLEVIGLFGGR